MRRYVYYSPEMNEIVTLKTKPLKNKEGPYILEVVDKKTSTVYFKFEQDFYYIGVL